MLRKSQKVAVSLVALGSSLSSLASFVAWPAFHGSTGLLPWGVGAIGSATYTAIAGYVERESFRMKPSKRPSSAGWDVAAAMLIPPVGLMAVVATFFQ
jgi:hypothetical protein